MTIRQRVLKAFYPALMWLSKKPSGKDPFPSNRNIVPPESFYSLHSATIDGKTFEFAALKGKKVLLVNTASDCGYTGQYESLEKLYSTYKEKIMILAFPSNDFKEQEKGTDDQIADFCKINYGVSFPLMKKSIVIKGIGQHEVFQWLTDSLKNGWNSRQPSWNFSKYLVDENGKLLNYFAPSISPDDQQVIQAINH